MEWEKSQNFIIRDEKYTKKGDDARFSFEYGVQVDL